MDGNGRWAKERGWPRIKGHVAGVGSVRAITTACARLGVKQLTLYAFSTENWKRPPQEVGYLFTLLRRFLVLEYDTLVKNNVRLTAIGQLERFPSRVRDYLEKEIRLTAGHTGLTLCLALSYGSREEICRAARRLAEDCVAGRLAPDQITEELVSLHLYQPEMPEPDLLIRTAGEMRLSNFLLWQLSYAEFYVTETCWPDFREEELAKAFAAYARRTRRFGAVV